MMKKEYMTGFVAGILSGVLIMGAGFLGYELAEEKQSVLTNRASESKIQALEYLIEENYRGDYDTQTLQEGMYKGMLESLKDPYSVYYTAEEYKAISQSNKGVYSGIGILMEMHEDGGIWIREVYAGSPAEEAGFRAGDRICQVDGKDTAGMSMDEISAIVQENGEEGTGFVLERDGEKITVRTEVGEVSLPCVNAEVLDGKIGYLQIVEFTQVAEEQFKEAYEGMRSENIQALIVDLRDNPGGLVKCVCAILEEILPEGMIVYTEDKNGEREEFLCEGKTPIDIPMCVLVNGGSASSSEIFAGAVQDHGVGEVIGTQTYGKGVVQSLRGLSDGSAVRLTVSAYFTPNGHNIHEVGITPDVVVEVAEDGDAQLTCAMERMREAAEKE